MVTLKRAWSRGTVAIQYTPMAFIARLAALVPPPRFVAVRTLGVISPHATLRPLVLPVPPTPTPERPVAPPRPDRLSWAELMKRVLSLDPLDCPCGGRFWVVSMIQEPDVIEVIAAAIIASGHLAPHRAPRGPPARVLRRKRPARAPLEQRPLTSPVPS